LTSCKPVSFSRRTLHRGVSIVGNTAFSYTVLLINADVLGLQTCSLFVDYQQQFKFRQQVLSCPKNTGRKH